MSEREGGGVRVRNGMLVVEGEQIGHCCRDLARWCTIRYREKMLAVETHMLIEHAVRVLSVDFL